jgi:hypothetical protein
MDHLVFRRFAEEADAAARRSTRGAFRSSVFDGIQYIHKSRLGLGEIAHVRDELLPSPDYLEVAFANPIVRVAMVAKSRRAQPGPDEPT